MQCDDVFDLLPLYAAGSCTEEQRNQVVRHISTCKICLQALIDEMKIHSAIHEALNEFSTPDFSRVFKQTEVDSIPGLEIVSRLVSMGLGFLSMKRWTRLFQRYANQLT